MTFPLSFLILCIWALSFFLFASLVNDLLIFVYFLKELTFSVHWSLPLLFCLFVSILFISILFFIISISYDFGALFVLLSEKVIWNFFPFLKKAYITMHFCLRTTFVASHWFWYTIFLFSLVSQYFLISLSFSSVTLESIEVL